MPYHRSIGVQCRFELDEDDAIVNNPTNRGSSTVGPFSETPGVFNGFTLPELAVLHLYRRRTA